ncbi:MAG: hypothetical protein AB7K09_17000, partial [Planctomycetota bacterium]
MRSSDTHHPEPTGSGPGDLTLTRRQLLIYGSLTGAMALFAGCSRAPEQQAIPFLEQPEQTTPGISRWYSTTCGGCAAGCSAMARVLDGRPIKLEGAISPLNPNGGLCVAGHAQIRGLYDADRFAGPRLGGEQVSWEALDQHVSSTLNQLKNAGRPVAFLTDRISGPAMRSMIARFVAAFPNVVHHEVDPGVPAAMANAWKQATGADAVPDLRLDRARVIVGVEADFLGAWWQPVSLAARYADARHPDRTGGMARHVQIESRHSLTGGNADQRVVVAPSQMRAVLAQLLVRVGKAVGTNLPLASAPLCAVPDASLDAVTNQLVAARGDAVVVCGVEDVPTQLLAGALNSLLGSIRPDGPLDIAHPVSLPVASTAAVGNLIDDATAGRLGGLIVLGHNPVHSHPRGADLAAALGNVLLSVALDLRETETTAACHTVSPTPHFLECWGDGQPRNDLLTLSQPTVRPLRDCRSWAESLMRWSGDEKPDVLAVLKQYWRTNVAPVLLPAAAGSGPAADRAFDLFWRA